MSEQPYHADYRHSWALLIGVDRYAAGLPPLSTAVKGMQALADALRDDLGFDAERVIALENEHATQRSIRRALTDPLSQVSKVGPDDRVVVYFAGHGITFDTAEGEIGCIAPYDVEPGFIDSAIPMDELTRLANRMHAKHVLFLLDACFSGFATTRDAAAGVERQVQDFLVRPARQVITAGTRDQAVSDYWGPGGHSLFTGFLLEGLHGSAPTPGGVLRAFHLAGYLQDQVAQHSRSHQTPQYAALIGSRGGDFILGRREVSVLPEWLLALAESQDATQRLIAVGQLRGLAQRESDAGQSAQAVARLEALAADDPDTLVRSSAEAAIREMARAPLDRTLREVPRVPAPADAAAEADAPALLIVGGPAAGTRYDLPPGETVIGRTDSSDLPLEDTLISRRHASVERRADGLWLTDLHSTNGTYLNDERVEGPRRLAPGDEIRVGHTVFSVAYATPEAAPAYEARPEPAARPPESAGGVTETTPPGEWQPVSRQARGTGVPAAPAQPPPQARPSIAKRAVTAAMGAKTEGKPRKRRRTVIIIAAVVFSLCVLLVCLSALSNGGYYY